jgi:thiamine-monophosphate kinase
VKPGARGRRSAGFSERAFHAWIARGVRATSDVPLPVGDDAAVVRLREGRAALLTTDALVEGTHFLPSSPPRLVGRAAAAVSLSDVAAKGGWPVGLLLDLLLPPTTDPKWARSVVEGARSEMRRWSADLLGGDTKPSGTRAVVGTVLAEADARRLAPRRAARPGDVIVLTGTVGRGGAAAARLGSGRPTPAVLRALLAVEPRLREGRVLVRFARAMLDTSDGLGESAALIAAASRVRVTLDRERLPVDPVVRRLPTPQRGPAVFFGGDYELMAAVPAARAAAAVRAVERVGGSATAVGRVEAGRGTFLQRGTAVGRMPTGGWDPFRWARRRV